MATPEVHKLYATLDQDKTGQMSVKELEALLCRIGCDPADADETARLARARFAAEGDGVHISAFLEWLFAGASDTVAAEQYVPPADAEQVASSGDVAFYCIGKVSEPESGGYQPYTCTLTYCATVKGVPLDLDMVAKCTTRRDDEDHDVSYELKIGDVFFQMEDESGRNFVDEKVNIVRHGKIVAAWVLSSARGGQSLGNIHTSAQGIYSGLASIADIAEVCGSPFPVEDVMKCIVALEGGHFLRVYLQADLLQLAQLCCGELPLASPTVVGCSTEVETVFIEIHGVQFPRPTPVHGGNRDVLPEHWGITCRQFYQFLNHCKRSPKWKELQDTEGFGGKVGYVNGYELCDHFVKPYTRGSGSGVALCLNAKLPLQSQVMLSHCWGESLEEVRVALLSLEGLAPDTSLWFCILANYQCGDEAGDVGPTLQEQLDQDPFGRVIRLPTLRAMAVIQTSTAEVYERLWCVYEIAEAVTGGVRTCSVTSNRGTSQELKAAVIDTEAGKCSNARDEEMIRSKIQAQGGYEKLNKTITEFRNQEEKAGEEARRLIVRR
ncbi:unnamed protein product [Polarella glacialis]|uniref:EF-hand domain-containing protein n=1 Tax=Polarella glacialis TaxID=89957 RepID=A0A813JA68_POLGL|nr:unnamed protein product [Polarella glacialis]